MRLTLRTMLAFLDHVLDGPDAQELGQKIDESKFASDLVHRIRSSVRRLRLGAPKVDGKGMGADANTVAEYLDNTMPPEQFPEFEKVCLESDVHLAEVAACHQILALVLGEPAAVEPGIRERMYRIGQPGGTATSAGEPGAGNNGHEAAAARAAEPAAASVRITPVPPRPHTADAEDERVQLASAARSVNRTPDAAFPIKSLLLTLTLGFVVAVVALRAIAPFNTNHPVWRLFAGTPVSSDLGQAPLPPAETASGSATPDSSSASVEGADPQSAGTAAAGSVSGPATAAPATAVPAAGEGAGVDVQPVVTAVPESGTVPPGSGVAAPAIPPGSAPLMPAPASGGDTAATVPPGDSNPPPSTPEPAPAAADAVVASPAAASDSARGPAVAPRPATTPMVAPRPAAPAAPLSVGRYISEDQVLARLDGEKNAWMVLPANTAILADEPLLSLPTYRPQLLAAPSMKLTVAGEALLRLQAPDGANVPQVTLDLGRVLLFPVGEMGNVVQIDFAGRPGQLVFADAESAAAVEVRPYLSPGSDPERDPPSVVVQIWATSGGVEWREGDRPPVVLTVGQRGQFIDEEPFAVVLDEVIPNWVDGKNLSEIDRRASQELRKFLTSDRPLALSLLEQTSFRQVEVRALACRSLCYLDIFEPALGALGDSQQKSYWSAQLAAIQSALPFGAATLEKLHTDIEKVYGDQSGKVYRLLWGYSPEQLADGGAAELVDALENENLVIRVLGFLTLNQITDKTLLFRPEERPEQEKSKVTRWRKALEEGQIVYKTPPAPFPPAPPAPLETAK